MDSILKYVIGYVPLPENKKTEQPHIQTQQELIKIFNEYTPHEIQIIEAALSKDEFNEFKSFVSNSNLNTLLNQVYPIIQKYDKVPEEIRELLHGNTDIVITQSDDGYEKNEKIKKLQTYIEQQIQTNSNPNPNDHISINKLTILKLYNEIISFEHFEATLNEDDITLQLQQIEKIYEYENLTLTIEIPKIQLIKIKELKRQIQIFNISQELTKKNTDTTQKKYNQLLTILTNNIIEQVETYYSKVIEYIIKTKNQNRVHQYGFLNQKLKTKHLNH